MVDTVKATNDLGREVEVEVGADGESPVSPNNPPAKAVAYDRLNPETSEKDESVGIDGDRPVSPNNPPEGTQTRSEDVTGGVAPEGVDEAVVEAAQNEWYPASYQPVKVDETASQVVYGTDDEGETDVSESDSEDPVEAAAENEQEPVSPVSSDDTSEEDSDEDDSKDA